MRKRVQRTSRCSITSRSISRSGAAVRVLVEKRLRFTLPVDHGRRRGSWTGGTSRPHIPAMRQEDLWDTEAAESYDTPGTGMFAPEVLGPAVDRLAELTGNGPALEFAIGTGRVAVPLRQRGIP